MSLARRSKGSIAPAEAWFASRGWKPFAFQKETWKAQLSGSSGLLHCPTGSGKTLAVWMGPLLDFLARPVDPSGWTRRRGHDPAPPLLALWVTPLRALAADTAGALLDPVVGMGLPWTIESRTGDTSASTKQRQRRQLPTALITTPESLTLLLSYPESKEHFANLRTVIVDEWHELIGTKRGIQTELALGRLRAIAPRATRWGVSATLGNLDEALRCLVGSSGDLDSAKIVHGGNRKKVVLDSELPPTIERFPWAGHLGMTMSRQVAARIEGASSTLVFTNTRNQTELWYQELLRCRPDWAGLIALHHGSLDNHVRTWVEDAMRDGKLKAVVCTSSLDLGVDYSAVEQVLQVGSPKGTARLLQRAGRSGHQPGATSRLTFIPTHALELIELAAARRMMKAGAIESRPPLRKPLDCLAQHAVTRALARPYTRDELLAELRDTHAYRDLEPEELDWALKFVVQGGDSLRAYPEFHRVAVSDGLHEVTDTRVARLHRMAIGTITSDVSVKVQYLKGATIGSVEESFASKLKRGDRFLLAGRLVELVQIREAVAYVRKAKGTPNAVPRWMGGRMPLSTQLADGVRQLLDEASRGMLHEPELEAIGPILEVQAAWSSIPRIDELLIETFEDRGVYHACVYPFEGRLVHEGLAAVLAHHWSRQRPSSYSIAVNDYGFIISSSHPIETNWSGLAAIWSGPSLEDEIASTVNATEMCKRQFREIARIAGLIHGGIPGQPKRAKHLQASANMFFDVFSEYDPENLLLRQARREVFELQFELGRLRATAERIAGLKLVVQPLRKPTPLAFPLFIEKMRDRLSSESLADRVRRMQAALEVEASRTLGGTDPRGRDNKGSRSRSQKVQGDSVKGAEPVVSEPVVSTTDQG